MSDFECYCDYDDVSTSVYRASIVRARKVHRCEECGGPIRPSEQYEYVFAIWDNEPSTINTCARCIDLRTWTKNNVPCFCMVHGNMDEQMRVAVSDARQRAPAETVGLHFGLLRRFVLRRRHNKLARAA